VGVQGILLGPERTSPRVLWGWSFWVGPGMPGAHQTTPGLDLRVCGLGWWVVVCGGVGGSLVENCTVDASIFVVKLSRANGGCLGTRSR